ncbi:uncharacterized protein LOC26528619 [Drosophila mojavensis]|uniref:uncharacterized protein LOC26528619 n=1 Tax=Drosophila mojavensis TaxID=7230 RepID=UPI001CD0FD7D|nr:uncharacterized protein LOC26528619 [Drosophila mojavensis]
MRQLLQVIPWLFLLLLSQALPRRSKCYHNWGYDSVINKCVPPYGAVHTTYRPNDLLASILIKPNCAEGHVWQQELMTCVRCPATGCNQSTPKPQLLLEKHCPNMQYLNLATKKCVNLVPPVITYKV